MTERNKGCDDHHDNRCRDSASNRLLPLVHGREALDKARYGLLGGILARGGRLGRRRCLGHRRDLGHVRTDVIRNGLIGLGGIGRLDDLRGIGGLRFLGGLRVLGRLRGLGRLGCPGLRLCRLDLLGLLGYPKLGSALNAELAALAVLRPAVRTSHLDSFPSVNLQF